MPLDAIALRRNVVPEVVPVDVYYSWCSGARVVGDEEDVGRVAGFGGDDGEGEGVEGFVAAGGGAMQVELLRLACGVLMRAWAREEKTSWSAVAWAGSMRTDSPSSPKSKPTPPSSPPAPSPTSASVGPTTASCHRNESRPASTRDE